MSLSNFIKTILNIQDDNTPFPEEEYYQVTQKDDYLIKIFRSFLKSDYCACPCCNSKNIVKNGLRNRKIRYIPIQNYNIELTVQRYICKDYKKTFHLPLILLVITLVYLIILSMLLHLNFKKYFSYIYY